MADFRTVFTDDDGDGFYDDVHVVNVMEEPSSPRIVNHNHSTTTYTVSSTGSIFSAKTKLKLGAIIFGILIAISFVSPIFIFGVVFLLKLLGCY